MMNDCRPRRRFRQVATSNTLEISSWFFLNLGFCENACRTASPIGHALCSNRYHSGAPRSSCDAGRVGGYASGASLSARSHDVTMSFSEVRLSFISRPNGSTLNREGRVKAPAEDRNSRAPLVDCSVVLGSIVRSKPVSLHGGEELVGHKKP